MKSHNHRHSRSCVNRSNRYSWSQINWSLQNIEIAAQLGCTRAAVSLARKRLGMPRSPRHKQKTTPRSPDRILKAKKYSHLTVCAASKKVGVDYTTLWRWRQKFGLKFAKPKKTDWSQVDWSQSTTDIARQLKCHSAQISRMRRQIAPKTLHYVRV